MAKKTARTRQKAPSTKLPKAPKPYREFVTRYPGLVVAGTIGLPSAVACWSWLRDAAGRES
jgi:hypothetical protein